jgi:hypothetical protein
VAEVNKVEVMLPKQCAHCEHDLPQEPGKVMTQGEPRRHQVTEVPPIKAYTTEYQFPDVVCEHCGKTTHMPQPAELAGHFGPQLTALIAYWTVVCRLPRRLVEAMLADVFGIEISLGEHPEGLGGSQPGSGTTRRSVTEAVAPASRSQRG